MEVTDAGARKLGIQTAKNGIFSRGILMDIPALKGVDYLEPGDAIYPEDLDAWEKKAGVKVGRGDVLLVRTGRWARRDAKGVWDVSETAAGMYASCARWLHQREIAMLGSDAASEVAPSGIEGIVSPIHQLSIIAMGVPIFDNWRPGGPQRHRPPPEPLGVPDHGGPAAGRRRHRIAAQPHCDLLRGTAGRQADFGGGSSLPGRNRNIGEDRRSTQ